jgi:hypothetical protein
MSHLVAVEELYGRTDGRDQEMRLEQQGSLVHLQRLGRRGKRLSGNRFHVHHRDALPGSDFPANVTGVAAMQTAIGTSTKERSLGMIDTF